MATRLAVPAGIDGARLDAALHALCLGLSRSRARFLCARGCVAIGGVRAGPSDRVRKGDRIDAWTEDFAMTEILGLPVARSCGNAIAIDKPEGLACHGGPLVEDSVAARLARIEGAGLAHRLDRGTSGLLLAGLDRQTLAALAGAMERGMIRREYLAVANGPVGRDEFEVDLPLAVTDQPRGDLPKTVADERTGLPCRSRFWVIDRRGEHVLLRCAIETGRTHQIRAHLLAAGHRLLGDPRYGDPAANERARATYGIRRPMLHAIRLEFPDPATAAPVAVESFAPPDFARLFRSLRGTAEATGS
ncbi:MAG: RluA family pseudouridine synthase [Planctomycetota bacterium]